MSLAERLGQASIELASPVRQAEEITAYEYLSEQTVLKQEVQDHLMDSMGQQLYSGRIDAERLEKLVYEAIQAMLA